jgi:hypothetical protein
VRTEFDLNQLKRSVKGGNILITGKSENYVLNLFEPQLSRFVFDGRTNVIACASDTHFHVLGNSDRESSFRIVGSWFSSVQPFKSCDESVNPVWVLL